MSGRCFVCGKKLGRRPMLVTCSDEQDVFVGSECGKMIQRAKADGWQPPKGGPRLYALAYDPKGKPTLQEIGERYDQTKRQS